MPDRASADAPGRVNLIGEHTDYHDGYVLPAIIPQRTRVSLRRRDDRRVRARSPAVDAGWQEYEAGREVPGRGWLDYVQGVTVALTRRDLHVAGFEVQIESDIPVGAGVSSSAALEVSLLRGLRTLFDFRFDDVCLAKMARAAETDFVGAPVGIMDQIASSLGRDGEALFLDTRTLEIERLPLPPAIELVVIHSGIAHAHAGGEYVERRRQSFEAAALLGVERLRDVDTSAAARIDALPPTLARRARHIVTENERVLAAVAALRTGDVRRLGELFAASHASMRDDYEISTPEIDALVSLGEQHPHIFGARLTGGGFGGAVVMIAAAGRARAAATEIRHAYRLRTGGDATVLIPAAPDNA
jgi:galactokinase